MLKLSQIYLDASIYEYALLLMVVAAEVKTVKFVDQALMKRDVSKKRIRESNLTYSQKLNFLLPSLIPLDMTLSKEITSQINKARTLRNDFMHEGNFACPKEELLALFAATVEYIQQLSLISNKLGL